MDLTGVPTGSGERTLMRQWPALRTEEGGECVPTLWRSKSGAFQAGYQTDTGTDVLAGETFENAFIAGAFANEFTREMCEL